jgi:hypothetical protein
VIVDADDLRQLGGHARAPGELASGPTKGDGEILERALRSPRSGPTISP